MSRTHSRTRRAEVQPTVGLIVEGDAEFEAFPLLHKKKLVAGCPPLKPINPGGVKPSTDVHVVIANRAFEAWLLADAKGLHQRKVFKRPRTSTASRGKPGSASSRGPWS